MTPCVSCHVSSYTDVFHRLLLIVSMCYSFLCIFVAFCMFKLYSCWMGMIMYFDWGKWNSSLGYFLVCFLCLYSGLLQAQKKAEIFHQLNFLPCIPGLIMQEDDACQVTWRMTRWQKIQPQYRVELVCRSPAWRQNGSDTAIIPCLNSIKRTPLSRTSKVKGMGSQIFSSFKWLLLH